MALEQLYDRAFFREYGAANPVYAAACDFIGAELARRFAPRTAVDWGCGAGLHTAALLRRGVDAIGIDGVEVAPDLRAPAFAPTVADLTRPVVPPTVPAAYDLSLCIDVMEHLPEEHAGAALANITRGAALVILSCAPPNQGGHHHVNEQPRRYWIARMRALGWTYDQRETGLLNAHFRAHRAALPLSWMYHNLCIYRP